MFQALWTNGTVDIMRKKIRTSSDNLLCILSNSLCGVQSVRAESLVLSFSRTKDYDRSYHSMLQNFLVPQTETLRIIAKGNCSSCRTVLHRTLHEKTSLSSNSVFLENWYEHISSLWHSMALSESHSYSMQFLALAKGKSLWPSDSWLFTSWKADQRGGGKDFGWSLKICNFRISRTTSTLGCNWGRYVENVFLLFC